MKDRRADTSVASGPIGLLAIKSREYSVIEHLLANSTKFRSEFVPHWQTILKKTISQGHHHIAEKILEKKFTVVNIVIAQLACTIH
jgi:hypothetical protein